MAAIVELLWFRDCPNHQAAEALVRDVLDELDVAASIQRVEVPDEATGVRVRFPGSPTIRVNGLDVEPGFDPAACTECTPRCRLYATADGLRGLPERDWIRQALEAAR